MFMTNYSLNMFSRVKMAFKRKFSITDLFYQYNCAKFMIFS